MTALLATGEVVVLAAERSVYRDLFVTLGIMLAVFVLACIGFVWLRRRARQPQVPPREAFTLDQLRQLHKQGLISDAEYERARDCLVRRLNSGVKTERHPDEPRDEPPD